MGEIGGRGGRKGGRIDREGDRGGRGVWGMGWMLGDSGGFRRQPGGEDCAEGWMGLNG